MKLVDVHAHLELISEKEREKVLARAAEKGVIVVINNGIDVASNRKSLELQEKHAIVKAALGLYPIDALKMTDAEINKELKFIEKQEFVALGEIGLDYQETEDRKRQQKTFEKQLELAKKLRKPVIVHSRKAEKEVVSTLIEVGCKKVILHAFHGNMKLVLQAVEAGFFFSVPSNILRSEHFQKLVERTPLEHLFTETDTPYLGPFEDRKSQPAYVQLTVNKIAEIKGILPDKVARQLHSNYAKMFNYK